MNVNDILPSSGCLSDRCLIALLLMSVWQAMSDDDVEETEFLDDAEALFGSRFLGGSNHCQTIPGQHSKALKDPHDPYKSVYSRNPYTSFLYTQRDVGPCAVIQSTESVPHINPPGCFLLSCVTPKKFVTLIIRLEPTKKTIQMISPRATQTLHTMS